MNQRYYRLLAALIILQTVTYVGQWSTIQFSNTLANWFLAALTIGLFAYAQKYFYFLDNKFNVKYVQWLIAWNISCIVRGMFDAGNYWEFKNLITNSFVLLMPLGVKVFTNKDLVQYITRYWIRFALPFFFIYVWFFNRGDAFGQYLAPVAFLCLFLFVLDKKWQLLILGFAVLAVSGDLNARSNVIRFLVALSFGAIYLLRNAVSIQLLIIARRFLLLLPILVFFLGASGTFNIFQIGDYLSGDFTTQTLEEGKREDANLTTDTRTFLYTEVLSSALKNNYFIFGRTPARGNDSDSFGDDSFYKLKTGRHERSANEVSILNIFTWTGLIGVFLTFLVFVKASFLAIHQSNNFLMRLVGLYVAFRWLFAWIEDFSDFNTTNFYLWMSIAACLSNSFRVMSDKEMKEWANGLFSIGDFIDTSSISKFTNKKL